MRKAFLFGVVLIMVMGIGFSATAAQGGFISSPGGNTAPEIVDCVIDGVDHSEQLKITPYSQKETLADLDQKELEDAYDDIAESADITDLNTDLKELADKLGIDGEDLGVSDLFDIGLEDCELHDEHNSFSIQLDVETLENFVGLMYKHDGEWKLVPGATVTGENKDTLTFSTNEISPFAIIVERDESPITPPPTGDDVNLMIYVALMGVSAVALLLVGTQLKKKDSK